MFRFCAFILIRSSAFSRLSFGDILHLKCEKVRTTTKKFIRYERKLISIMPLVGSHEIEWCIEYILYAVNGLANALRVCAKYANKNCIGRQVLGHWLYCCWRFSSISHR